MNEQPMFGDNIDCQMGYIRSDEDGEPAPYNGEPEYSINTAKAESCGYTCSGWGEWFWCVFGSFF